MHYCKKGLVLSLLILFFFSINHSLVYSKEIVIFDKNEDYTAYIDVNDLTIYLWNGKPTAYLEKNLIISTYMVLTASI